VGKHFHTQEALLSPEVGNGARIRYRLVCRAPQPSIFGAMLSASAQAKVVIKAPRGSQFALHASVVSLILDFSNLA